MAVCGVILATLAQQALAADAPFPVLRGTQTYEIAPPPYFRWEGMYAGGQVGASTANFDFTHAPQPLVAFLLRNSDIGPNVTNWNFLKGADSRGGSYGGFIGYNAQFEDVVVGIEGNYNRTNISANAAGALGRIVPAGGGVADVTVDSEASMRITDYATLRGRAGWAIGRFLPYAMIGWGVGFADITRSARVIVANTQSCPASNPCREDESKRAFIYGYSAGGGLDVALTSRIFLRGEYEYVKFAATSNISSSIQTARVGGGFRF